MSPGESLLFLVGSFTLVMLLAWAAGKSSGWNGEGRSTLYHALKLIFTGRFY